jgi:hypothetical protein
MLRFRHAGHVEAFLGLSMLILASSILIPHALLNSPSQRDVVGTSTVASDGGTIELGGFGNLYELVLVNSPRPPRMSQMEVMQAIHDLGIAWGLGEAVYIEETGETIVPEITGHFGLMTSGAPASDGTWSGIRNVSLADGTELDHIDNRAMWLLDYGNVIAHSAHVHYDHVVYLVDDETGTVIRALFYASEQAEH